MSDAGETNPVSKTSAEVPAEDVADAEGGEDTEPVSEHHTRADSSGFPTARTDMDPGRILEGVLAQDVPLTPPTSPGYSRGHALNSRGGPGAMTSQTNRVYRPDTAYNVPPLIVQSPEFLTSLSVTGRPFTAPSTFQEYDDSWRGQPASPARAVSPSSRPRREMRGMNPTGFVPSRPPPSRAGGGFSIPARRPAGYNTGYVEEAPYSSYMRATTPSTFTTGGYFVPG
eukprot:gene8715-33697_t